MDNLKELFSENPEIGTIIKNSGGVRKIRVSAQNKGKSGGARVIYYYYNETLPLLLLDVYAKSEKIDLDKSELANLRKLVENLLKNRKGGK